MTPACRHCGSTNLSFDYTGMTTIGLRDGKVTQIGVAGVLDGVPDAMNCHDCLNYGQEIPAGLDLAGILDGDEQVPDVVSDLLSNGMTVYDATGSLRRQRTFPVYSNT